MKHNPEKLRDSVISHTETLKQFGVSHVLKSVPDSKIETPTDKILNELGPDACDVAMEVNDVDIHGTRTLDALKDHIGPCTRCKLAKGRTNLVFGAGHPNAKLMFVGEAPGADEDEQGVPFVGRAGKLLTDMILAMGFGREDVYIANVVKCRPPNNRNPEPDEIASCMPFLKKQIEIVNPRVLVCLGKFAAQTVLKTEVAISKLRGRFHERDGITIMPTFHPSYLLRNPGMKKSVWEDLQQVMKKLKS